jgi:hypothetical protein
MNKKYSTVGVDCLWRSHNTIASGSLTHTPNFGYTSAILPQNMKVLDLLKLK